MITQLMTQLTQTNDIQFEEMENVLVWKYETTITQTVGMGANQTDYWLKQIIHAPVETLQVLMYALKMKSQLFKARLITRL